MGIPLLHYDQLYAGISGTAQKSGNISQLVWRTRGRDRQAYSFHYDYLDRLTQGDYYDIRSTGPVKTDDYFTRIRYAPFPLGEGALSGNRGNISEIDRHGWYPSGGCWTSAISGKGSGRLDHSSADCMLIRIGLGSPKPIRRQYNWFDILDFTYFPGTNRLKTVTDVVALAARPYGFNGSSSSPDYQYDANGNQTYVPNRDVTLTYNHRYPARSGVKILSAGSLVQRKAENAGDTACRRGFLTQRCAEIPRRKRPHRFVTGMYLPETMDFPGTDEIELLYDATDIKIRQTITQSSTTVTRNYVADTTSQTTLSAQ